MQTPDPKKINEAIDGMTSICDKGKAEVRKLLEAVTGVELSSEPTITEISPGDVFESKDYMPVMAVDSSHFKAGVLMVMIGSMFPSTSGISVSQGPNSTRKEIAHDLASKGFKKVGRVTHKGFIASLERK